MHARRRRLRHEGRGVSIGQVDIAEGNRPTRRDLTRSVDVAILDNPARRGRLIDNDRRRVVGAGDRDRERRASGLIVGPEIVVDERRVGQRQRLACGEEVEGAVRNVVGPGRRADVPLAGILHDVERDRHVGDRR